MVIIILNVIVCDEWTPTVSAPSLSITPGQGMMESTQIQDGIGWQRGPTPLLFQSMPDWGPHRFHFYIYQRKS